MISLKLVAAFCAAEKTDEKNPPAPPGELEALTARPPGVLTSSTVGVSGGAIALDNLLGARVVESDCTLRWAGLPEAGATVFPLGAVEALLEGASFGKSRSWSVGVGGVIVVVGASETVLAIDLGDVAICGMLCRLWFGLLRLVCDTPAAASISEGLEPFFKLTLFFFSLEDPAPSESPVPFGASELFSGVSNDLLSFCEPVVNISLMRVPGEMPRPSLEGLLLEDLSCDSGPKVVA